MDVRDRKEMVDDGEDSEAGSGVDVKFGTDIAAMGCDGVDRDAELVSDFLVGESACN